MNAKKIITLQEARKNSKIEQFIKEHEDDPHGDMDKLAAIIKTPVLGKIKEVRSTSGSDSEND